MRVVSDVVWKGSAFWPGVYNGAPTSGLGPRPTALNDTCNRVGDGPPPIGLCTILAGFETSIRAFDEGVVSGVALAKTAHLGPAIKGRPPSSE